jgi:GT2 family glycosyltransferase
MPLMSDNFKQNISIIIVNYKSWKPLELCLKSITDISFHNLNIETIVVDNCSNDNYFSVFQLKFPSVSFSLNSGNNGFANACNLGAKKASGEFLLFLNPDTIINKMAIEKMHNYLLENSNIGLVSCLQKNSDGSYEKSFRFFPSFKTIFGIVRAINGKQLRKNIIRKNNILFPDWVSGAVVLISINWFDKIQGWNEDYWMYFEDVDLSKKVADLGGEIALLENVEIIHNHGGSSRINIKTAAITKTEVLISKHVYINNHFKGFQYFLIQYSVITTVLISKLILGIFGFVFFYKPRLKLESKILVNLIEYYLKSILNRTFYNENKKYNN